MPGPGHSAAQTREARDSDGAAIMALVEHCFADYAGCVLDKANDCPDLFAPATYYRDLGGKLWVVDDGGLIATVAWHPLDAARAELKRLYVHADARRQGLGATLGSLVEDSARTRGIKTMELWTDTRFDAAHRLYDRLGYALQPETRDLQDLSNSIEYQFIKTL